MFKAESVYGAIIVKEENNNDLEMIPRNDLQMDEDKDVIGEGATAGT